MTSNTNPWGGMNESSRRRIDTLTDHDVYWIVDLHGHYGLQLDAISEFTLEANIISFSGIDVIKNNSEKVGTLILLLNEQEDWPIFHTLCKDLVATVHRYDSDEMMIHAIEVRLQRWQELLKKENSHGMSMESQMGLFSELSFLKSHLSPEVGLEQAITSWVGPDRDKQDFLIDNAVIEVKSHRTSKGEIASISSAAQLHSEKEPLYLISYGLTKSDNGYSIASLAEEIKNLLLLASELIREDFETKLIDYGYIAELETKPLACFIIDTEKIYLVSEAFPAITPLKIMTQITFVKYVIDLSLCTEFEVQIESIFQEKQVI